MKKDKDIIDEIISTGTLEKIMKLLAKISGVFIMKKPLISISEAALFLDTSESSIYRLLKKNDDILSIKEPGIGRRIIKSTLDKHFDNKIKKVIEKREKEDKEVSQFVNEIISDLNTRQFRN
ncbi:MAG: hypothetical protein ACTSWK_14095 [Promethearchaeota archaeon]